MSLWLCLRFGQLPLQCLNRSEDQPVAVLTRQRVLRANDCAAALGVREGMGTATVRALSEPQPVQLLERDPAAEQRCLQQLCCWAYSITPTLYSWRDDCLQLEIGSCLSLFRGLDALLAEVRNGISGRGYQFQLGLAPTPKAAWLLSFGNSELAMASEQPLTTRLAPLPLNLLRDFTPAVASLRRAGLHTLGDILNLPASAIGRRCGGDFSRFLQQVLGQATDLQVDYQPPAAFQDTYWFGYEVRANAELLPAVQLLLQSLCRFLRNTQLNTGEITWQLTGIDHGLRELQVRSSSGHSDWEHWYQLSCIRIDQLQLKAGVEGIALLCTQLESGHTATIDLFSPRQQKEPLGSLLDRLRSRLGLQAIEQVGCRDEHLPEFAVYVSPDHQGDETSTSQACAQRPFWLLPQPQALRAQGRQLYWNGALELVYGPERIEDNWWHSPVSRDYYIAENSAGQHYWVFRDRLARQWYIHGIFA